MTLYKYLPPERFDVLEHGRIRFTQPAAFNDPFETLPCFSEYKRFLFNTINEAEKIKFGSEATQASLRELQERVDQALLDIPKTLSQYFVILSLSKVRNNLLMWSHYTQSHRGFVLGFDSSHPFFSPGDGKAVDGLRDVTYSQHRYLFPSGGFTSRADKNLPEANAAFFFTKSEDWRYEQEVRILANPRTANVTIPHPDGQDICLFDFPPDCLTEVILGFRMSADTKAKFADTVLKKYHKATIYCAELDEVRFQLNVKLYANS